MGQEVAKIKKRIKSVTGAYKVTSAMKLISTVKLKGFRSKMLSSRDYIDKLTSIMSELYAGNKEIKSKYSVTNNSNKNLYVIVSSTLGLCGSYNQNIFKEAEAKLTNADDAIILGKKGIVHFVNSETNHINDFEEYNSIKDELTINKITNYILNEYLNGKYHEIHFIYSKYVNPLVFKATDEVLLPLKPIISENISANEPICEPNKETLIEALSPFYVKNSIYSKLLESEVCEHASRSNAMENATKNAEELLSDLRIQFNKARQGAITQEIIEITSGSNV